MGRPTAYKEEYDEQAYRYCLLGATDKFLADAFGVSEQTINTWKKQHPSFLESLKSGKIEADARVAESLYKKATGFYREDAVKIFMPAGAETPVYAQYTEYYPPDTGAAFIWLKNRAGWRDRQEVEHSGGIDIQIEFVDAKDTGT